MSSATDTDIAPAPKEAMQLDANGVYIVTNQNQELRVAEMLLRSGAVNNTLKTPVQVVMAMQAAKSLGLNPYTALRQMGFVNGSLMLYGDLPLAVVRKSGKLAHKEEFLYCLGKDGQYQRRCFANSNAHLPVAGAVCRVGRVGEDYIEEASCSVDDAKLAGLWGRTPTWRSHPGRMLQLRARGLCLRNMFPDVLEGTASDYDEYVQESPVQNADGAITGTQAALKMLRDKQAGPADA